MELLLGMDWWLAWRGLLAGRGFESTYRGTLRLPWSDVVVTESCGGAEVPCTYAYCVRIAGGCCSDAAKDNCIDGMDVCIGISCGSCVKFDDPESGIFWYESAGMLAGG